MRPWGWFLVLALAPRILPAATELKDLFGEDLGGKPFTLEARAPGRTVVLVAGFSKASSKDCQAFEDVLWRDFGSDTRVAIASVAELQGLPGFLVSIIKASMRKNVPPERYPWKWVLRQDRTLWQEAFGYDGAKAPDAAYLALLEANGKGLISRSHATFSTESYTELKEHLGLVLDPPRSKKKSKKH